MPDLIVVLFSSLFCLGENDFRADCKVVVRLFFFRFPLSFCVMPMGDVGEKIAPYSFVNDRKEKRDRSKAIERRERTEKKSNAKFELVSHKSRSKKIGKKERKIIASR